MSVLTIPNSFTSGQLIQSALVNANFVAISNWAAGNIDNTNLGTFAGPITWSISSAVNAINITSTGTADTALFTQNGILAANKAIIHIVDNVAETTGLAGLYVGFTGAGSTIPVAMFANAGTGTAVNISQTGVSAASKAPFYLSDTAAETLGKAIEYVEATNASSTIPMRVVKNAGTGDYVQYQDGNGNVLAAIDRNGNFSKENLLLNGAFDIWQAGIISTNAGAFPNDAPHSGATYVADNWYVNNPATVSGLVRMQQSTGFVPNSKFGAACFNSSALNNTSPELYTVLDNNDSQVLYNQAASFSIQAKGLGNVTQIGIQFCYGTTEVKPTNFIGSEQLFTVTPGVIGSAGTFTLCRVLNQALGTAMTTSGVIGVRIRPTAVSSGNLFDANNGFVVEQAMLSLGTTVGAFKRKFNSFGAELAACQRYFEKSYDYATGIGANTGSGANGSFTSRIIGGLSSATFTLRLSFPFKVTKRSAGTTTYFSTDGTSGRVRDNTNASNLTPTVISSGQGGAQVEVATAVAASQYWIEFHWYTDSRI